jgi:hypothetical protein
MFMSPWAVVVDKIGMERLVTTGSAVVCAIGGFNPTDGANGLAKGIANSNELLATPCPAALRPTTRTPISASPYRIAPLSRTSWLLDSHI